MNYLHQIFISILSVWWILSWEWQLCQLYANYASSCITSTYSQHYLTIFSQSLGCFLCFFVDRHHIWVSATSSQHQVFHGEMETSVSGVSRWNGKNGKNMQKHQGKSMVNVPMVCIVFSGDSWIFLRWSWDVLGGLQDGYMMFHGCYMIVIWLLYDCFMDVTWGHHEDYKP